jgi:hypothetical protein
MLNSLLLLLHRQAECFFALLLVLLFTKHRAAASRLCARWLAKRKARLFIFRSAFTKRKPQAQRGSLTLFDNPEINYLLDFGVTKAEFNEIYNRMMPMLVRPRRGTARIEAKRILHPKAELALCLNYLREGGRYRRLVKLFRVDKSIISRTLRSTLPKLLVVLRGNISFPKELPPSVNGVQGAIDCTAHFRRRVHPGQALFYRADKRGHFWYAQVVVGLQGEVWDVKLVAGHNNDQGALHLTGMSDLLAEKELYLAGDGGYSHPHIITMDEHNSPRFNYMISSLRSVVESVNGYSKTYMVAAEVSALSPELHAVALMCIWELTAYHLKKLPLRSIVTLKRLQG